MLCIHVEPQPRRDPILRPASASLQLRNVQERVLLVPGRPEARLQALGFQPSQGSATLLGPSAGQRQ